jgi:hypothetical protein
MWSSTEGIALFGQFAPAVLGGMGVKVHSTGSTGGVGSTTEASSLEGFVLLIEGILRETLTVNDQDHRAAVTKMLKPIGKEVMCELELRMQRQFAGTVVDTCLEMDFVDLAGSAAYRKLEMTRKEIARFDSMAEALPHMKSMKTEIQQLKEQVAAGMMAGAAAGAKVTDKRDRSGSASPIRGAGASAHSDRDVQELLRRVKALESQNKQLRFAKEEEVRSPGLKRQRINTALAGGDKHPDSGKLEMLKGHVVLTRRNGDKVGLPTQEVKNLMPDNLKDRCLLVACSNRTGPSKMLHCPQRGKPGHTSMTDTKHVGIPPYVARRFMEEAQPFR